MTPLEWADTHAYTIKGAAPLGDGWDNIRTFLRDRAHDASFRDVWDAVADRAELRAYIDVLELIRRGHYEAAEAAIRGAA